MKVGFVARPVGMIGNRFRGRSSRPPEIGDHPVEVVDRFELGSVRALQQHRSRSEEWLDVVRDVAQRSPYLPGDGGLATEPRERRVEFGWRDRHFRLLAFRTLVIPFLR